MSSLYFMLLLFQGTPANLPTDLAQIMEELVITGESIDHFPEKKAKKAYASKRMWIWDGQEWHFPWSHFDEESQARINFFKYIDAAIPYGKKIAFIARPREIGAVDRVGIFIYERGKPLKPVFFAESRFDRALNKEKLKEPVTSILKQHLGTQNLPKAVAPKMVDKAFHNAFIDYQFTDPSPDPIGWLADGKTLVVWRPKKLLFIPTQDGEPKLLNLLDLKLAHNLDEETRIRVIFSKTSGDEPVLLTNSKSYLIGNDWKLKPLATNGLNTSISSKSIKALWRNEYFLDGNHVLDQNGQTLVNLGKIRKLNKKLRSVKGNLKKFALAKNAPIMALAYAKGNIAVIDFRELQKAHLIKVTMKVEDLAISDDGSHLGIAILGNRKQRFRTDLIIAEVSTGELTPLNLKFLPFLDQKSWISYNPKVFSAGNYFFFKQHQQLQAVNFSGEITKDILDMGKNMEWDGYYKGQALFRPGAFLFIKEREDAGLHFHQNISQPFKFNHKN